MFIVQVVAGTRPMSSSPGPIGVATLRDSTLTGAQLSYANFQRAVLEGVDLSGAKLENARLEGYVFGRGWDWQSCRVDLLGETPKSLSAIPQAWTPGTEGAVRGRYRRQNLQEEPIQIGLFGDGARPTEEL